MRRISRCDAACGSHASSGRAEIWLAPELHPQHLAERIIGSRGALEGERKHVTVLFADLKGSMELLADRDPEDARRILDPVLERMMEAVHRCEGTVNQVMGDGTWRCLAHRSPTKITPCAPATPRCACRIP